MVPFQFESPGISRNNNIVIKQIRVYNGGGTLGNELGCWAKGIRWGDIGENGDIQYLLQDTGVIGPEDKRGAKIGGLISGIALVYNDGSEQTVGSVDDTEAGVSVDAYDFQDGEHLAEYSVATVVNPNGFWSEDDTSVSGFLGPYWKFYDTSGDNGNGSPWNQVRVNEAECESGE